MLGVFVTGVEELNVYLQGILNPPAKSKAEKKLGNAVACIPETGIMYLPESYYDKETGVTAEATGEMDFLHY